MAKILIAEDDEDLCMNLRSWLELGSYTVDVVNSGGAAKEYLNTFGYELVILDWDLPELSGIEVLSDYRLSGGSTPVLILTGKNSIENKEQGLDAGADDYLTKPFHMRELSARIRALLRRPPQATGQTIEAKGIVLDVASRKVVRSGEPVRLQPIEYAVLEFLMKNPNQLFSPQALLNRVWDAEAEVSLDALYSCIKKLRKKLDREGEPSVIKSLYGQGYIFET